MTYEAVSFVDDVSAVSAASTSIGGWMEQSEYLQPVSNHPVYIVTSAGTQLTLHS